MDSEKLTIWASEFYTTQITHAENALDSVIFTLANIDKRSAEWQVEIKESLSDTLEKHYAMRMIAVTATEHKETSDVALVDVILNCLNS